MDLFLWSIWSPVIHSSSTIFQNKVVPIQVNLCPLSYLIIFVSLFIPNLIYCFLLMKLSLLFPLFSPSAFSHNYEDISISIYLLKENESGCTYEQWGERQGDGPGTKQGLLRGFLLGNKRLQKLAQIVSQVQNVTAVDILKRLSLKKKNNKICMLKLGEVHLFISWKQVFIYLN